MKPQVAVTTRKHNPILAYSLALLAHFLFCSSNYFLKHAQRSLSTAQVQCHFFLQISIYTYCIASYKKYPFQFKSPFANKLLIFRAAIGMCNNYLVIYTFTLIPISETTVIGTLGPPIGAVLSSLVFGEKFEKVIIINGITGIIGVIFIAKPAFLFGATGVEVEAQKRALGIMISLVCAFLGSVIQLFIKKVGALTHPISQIYYFGIITSLVFPITLIFQGSQAMTGTDMFNVIMSGLSGTCAQMCLATGLQYGEAGKIGLFGYTQIIFAFLYEIVLDNRTPDSYSLFGTAIILCGFMILVSKALKKPPQVQALPSKVESEPMPAIKA